MLFNIKICKLGEQENFGLSEARRGHWLIHERGEEVKTNLK
jgi:hypothetical protein